MLFAWCKNFQHTQQISELQNLETFNSLILNKFEASPVTKKKKEESMAPMSFRRAIGAVKDQTSIGLAKVGSSTSLADLDVAIVKATRHDEYPAEERHIREILNLTCYSKAFVSACVSTVSRRISKTSSWTVALKSLVLIQRLLLEGDPAYEQDIFFSTRRGTRLLNMSDFRDKKSNSWDFSAFVRTYALYLDERLEYRMQNKRGRRSRFGFDDDEEERRQRDRNRNRDIEKDKGVAFKGTALKEMNPDQLFSKMQHLQLLLERFLACRPTGEAKTHRIVIVALYPIVKESFQIYQEMTDILTALVNHFTDDMEVHECIKVYDIFCRVGKQYDELDMFFSWSKTMGIARSSEYPAIERVTTRKLELMDEFIRDKTTILAQSRKPKTKQRENSEDKECKEPEPLVDVNETKALPPPEVFKKEPAEQQNREEHPKEGKVVQTMGDLLNLGDDDDAVTSSNEGEDQLAVALFDGAAPAARAGTLALPWRAFDDASDWETALVQSTSHLSNQKPSLGGGFDTLLLDGLYQHAEANAAMTGPGYGVSGSASSVALGSAGKPAMLALPAPPTPTSSGADPFAASLAVAPPTYVQMSEMERKQRLLVEEQALWQQYSQGAMQGQYNAIANQQQPNYYSTYAGGYQQNYWNYNH